MDGAKVTVRYRVTRDAIEQDILIEGRFLARKNSDSRPIPIWRRGLKLVESPAARIENRQAGDLPDQLVETGLGVIGGWESVCVERWRIEVSPSAKAFTDVAGPPLPDREP